MELNQEWLRKADMNYFCKEGTSLEQLGAAIETYLAEMFKPGPMMALEPLEAIPQRDYRKEAWIAAISEGGPNYGAEVLKAFDATFPQESSHG